MTILDPLAVGVMVAYCGWDPTIPISGETVLLDGDGTTLLALPCINVTEVSAVSITDRTGTVKTLIVGTDVTWSVNGLLTRTTCGWPVGQRNVSVTYSGGYYDIPDDLNAALGHLTNRLATLGQASRRMGTAAINFGPRGAAGDLLLIEQMVFDRYRIPRVK